MSYTRHEDHHKIAIDSDQYQAIALQIAQGNGISTQQGTPNFFRLPAYPLFLGYSYKLLGTKLENTLWLQLILSLTIPVLIFFLAATLLPEQILIAKIAAIAASLHPGFILFAGMQATESLFLIFFLLFLLFFFRGITNGRFSAFLLAGFSLGVASLFRALGHYVIGLMLILILLLLPKTLWQRLWCACILLCSWLSIVSIWLIRNYLLTGFIFLHTLPGQHFLRYNAANDIVTSENISYQDAKNKLFAQRDLLVAQQEKRDHRILSEPEKDTIAQQLAFQIMREHPLITFKHAYTEIMHTSFALYASIPFQVPAGTIFTPTTPTSFKINRYLTTLWQYPIIIPLIIWDLFFSFMLLLGILFFIYFTYKRRNAFKLWISTIPLIALLLGITLSVGLIRLRFPVEPFLIILASYGWLSFVQTNHHARKLATRLPIISKIS